MGSVETNKPEIQFNENIDLKRFLELEDEQFICIIEARGTRILRVSEYKTTPLSEIEEDFTGAYVWVVGVNHEFINEYGD